jgi:hypothetical protein
MRKHTDVKSLDLVNTTIFFFFNSTFQDKFWLFLHCDHNQSETKCGKKTEETLRFWHELLGSVHKTTHMLTDSLHGTAKSTKSILCKGWVLQNLADNKL